MKFKPGIPHLVKDERGQWCLQTFYRYITFNRSGRTYTTFRYWAACRWFDALKSA